MGRLILIVLTCCLISNAAHAQLCADIRPKVCSLQPGFDPANIGAAPSCDIGSPPTSSQVEDLQAGFNLIKQSGKADRVQADLCKLTNIFVVTDSSVVHSWGKWANPEHGYPFQVAGNAYIAVLAADLNKSLAGVQDEHLALLNGPTNATHSGSGDSKSVGALYIMTHELGHIKWRRDGIGCFNSALIQHSWKEDSELMGSKARPWTKFADKFGNHINADVPHPKGVPDNKLLEIYDNGFITALAAANPEEDFVESYAIRVVTTVSPSTVVQIHIGPATRALTFDREGSGRPSGSPPGEGLSDKAGCLDSLINSPTASGLRTHKAPLLKGRRHRR